MVYLHQLVNSDFILFDAAQTVAQAVAVVQRLQPTRIVVRRWENGRVDHYLYAARAFCDRLAQVDGERALADALALRERDATPTLDAWQDAESAPSRCVITEGDRVLGFYDAALPPAWNIKREVDTESTATAPVSRALQAEFPERVPLGQTASLLVWLTQQVGRPSALPVAAPDSPPLDFVFTVCDKAANEVCPVWPGQPMSAHWGVEDPAAVEGDDTQKMLAFRKALRELENRIKIFMSLPIQSLDRIKLQSRLDEIGQTVLENNA